MNLLLSASIGPKLPISYYNPIEAYIKARLPSILFFDCDNHSEITIIRYALDLLKEATKSVIVIRVEEGAQMEALGSLRLLVEQLVKSGDAVKIALTGTHPTLERLLVILPEDQVWKDLNETELCPHIELFLKDSEK